MKEATHWPVCWQATITFPVDYPTPTLVIRHRSASEQSTTMEGAYDYNAFIDVQWPFGYGLSYTTFEYSNLHVDKPFFTERDTLTITVDVRNTGSKAGKESVLLYSRDMVASIVPEGRRLRFPEDHATAG